jgi:predicted ester cyclase
MIDPMEAVAQANKARQQEFVQQIQNDGQLHRVADFVRYKDGQIAEHWNIIDMAGLMAQLGLS